MNLLHFAAFYLLVIISAVFDILTEKCEPCWLTILTLNLLKLEFCLNIDIVFLNYNSSLEFDCSII